MPTRRTRLYRTLALSSVNGIDLAISNPTKVLYPSGFTKVQVIDYYVHVSPFILPHLKDRPVTMKGYPDGMRGQHISRKEWASRSVESRGIPIIKRVRPAWRFGESLVVRGTKL